MRPHRRRKDWISKEKFVFKLRRYWRTKCNRRLRRKKITEDLANGSHYKKYFSDVWWDVEPY